MCDFWPFAAPPTSVHNAIDAPQAVCKGFTWAENVCFDGTGGCFVSDRHAGIVYKLDRDLESRAVRMLPWAYLFVSCGGVAYAGNNHLLIAGTQKNESGEHFHGIFTASTNEPTMAPLLVGKLKDAAAGITVSSLGDDFCHAYVPCPAGGKAGDGCVLRVCLKWENGNFTNLGVETLDKAAPGASCVAMSGNGVAVTGLTKSSFGGLFGAAGRTLLRFGAVDPDTQAYDRAWGEPLAPTGASVFGDFCIATLQLSDQDYPEQEYLLTTDTAAGTVVAFALDNDVLRPTPIVLAKGFSNPTSVRVGCGPGWEGALYVTEGNSALAHVPFTQYAPTCRVYEISVRGPSTVPQDL